ncbi:MAG: hypothetical protein J6Z49_04060 [Kiritimatiellae bacterium]|nr:hypothetical protein [Kiritimatiellia bacterium]
MKNTMVQRMKDSWYGKAVCRLFGEEKGAVMMEYVIVAVLIAAAAVIGVAMFGKTIVGMFSVAGDGATGKGNEATTTLSTVQGNKNKGFIEAGQTADKFSDASTQTKTK